MNELEQPRKEENISNIKQDKVDKPLSESSQESNSVKDTKTKKNKTDNKMREIEIEKMVLHCGGTEEKHEKSVQLLEMITGSKKIYIVKSKKRFPAFGIAPGKKSGCKITLRDKKNIKSLLERFFSAIENKLKKKQIAENQVCFGIPEYIEVPGLEYDRDIGILGFEVMLVFKRKGKRVKLRKIKQGDYPKKQEVTKKEIIDYLIKNFGLEVEGK
ncbi:MAG: 50S ribosomal protein L5 [archaeon]